MRTDLKKGENIILVVQKHWFIFIWPMVWTLIFFILSMHIFSLGREFKWIGNMFHIFAIISILILIYRIIARKYDLWIVTNFRVIDEHGIITHNSKETPLDKINNITLIQSFFGRVFDYGHIQIQTAAEMGATTCKFITSPKFLKNTITECQEEYKKNSFKNQAK